jgi:hypothetical protein
MGIVLKIINIYGLPIEKRRNYTAGYNDIFLYSDGTKRLVKKLYFFPPKIKETIQITKIESSLEGVADIIYYNKWEDT